ncbi:unnamed protein product [Gemmata massiliana]|uniref:Uncharacterized protein n=1 Tax=Gemmata massiliana TaxID=1210884 RepID=A0A6P2CXE0_9BACT|nr:unnamed protein product [Gemmata massiliana]
MLQFGPRCIWGETSPAPRSTDITSARGLQFGPRCIWGETRSRRTRAVRRSGCFNSAPDVSGERPTDADPNGWRSLASIRPQMYLGRDMSFSIRKSPRRPRLQFGPRCIWGETPVYCRVNSTRESFNSAPDVSGERRDDGVQIVYAASASIRPQMYLGRDVEPEFDAQPPRARRFNSAPDVSGERPCCHTADRVVESFNSAPDVSGERHPCG